MNEWDRAYMRKPVEHVAPQPEPVGEVYRYGRDSHDREWHGIHWYNANVDVPTGTKLYAAPPAAPAPAAPEEYDMADESGCPTCGQDGGTSCGLPNCGLLQGAAPAQPAVPLSDGQINAIWNAKDLPEHRSNLSPWGMDRIRAIIAASHGISTTGGGE